MTIFEIIEKVMVLTPALAVEVGGAVRRREPPSVVEGGGGGAGREKKTGEARGRRRGAGSHDIGLLARCVGSALNLTNY